MYVTFRYEKAKKSLPHKENNFSSNFVEVTILVITHKSARLRESGLLDECAPRSFAALRMTKPLAVILSAAKDLLWTYG